MDQAALRRELGPRPARELPELARGLPEQVEAPEQGAVAEQVRGPEDPAHREEAHFAVLHPNVDQTERTHRTDILDATD